MDTNPWIYILKIESLKINWESIKSCPPPLNFEQYVYNIEDI